MDPRNEFAEGEVFGVTGCGRSGTTSCINILGTASNAETFTEPRPRFTAEVRQYVCGELADPRSLIRRERIERIREVRSRDRIYGEKDLQVYCWLPFYRELFGMRFLFVLRNGLDVVRSFLDYHNQISGLIYAEAPDDAAMSARARAKPARIIR